jgi:hypothetical protein
LLVGGADLVAEPEFLRVTIRDFRSPRKSGGDSNSIQARKTHPPLRQPVRFDSAVRAIFMLAVD